MKKLFRQLLIEAKRVNPSAAGTLRRGLSPATVKEKLAKLPYAITPGAAALYEWADGADGPFELLPGGYFIPLNQAMKQFQVFRRAKKEFEEIEEWYEIIPQKYRDCFRFLSDWSDGGYAFGRVDSPSKGRIVKFCIEINLWQIGFRDLEHLLKTSIECYRQGVMRSGGDLPDFQAFYKLAARTNPGLKVWRAVAG